MSEKANASATFADFMWNGMKMDMNFSLILWMTEEGTGVNQQ